MKPFLRSVAFGLALTFSAMALPLLLLGLIVLLVDCALSPEIAPGDRQAVGLLEQAAARRDPAALLARFQEAARIKAAAASEEPRLAELSAPAPLPLAFARLERDACGPSPRPVLWRTDVPSVGAPFALSVDPDAGAVRPGDLYRWEFVWVLLQVGGALPSSPIVLPGGCALWLDPSSPAVLVWSLRGTAAFDDPILHRDTNGRTVQLRVAPLPRELAGVQVALQVVSFDAGSFRCSQTWSFLIGR